MKYIFFTNTPAHVHMYKHAVKELAETNHDVLVLARDYGCTESLLEYYGLDHYLYGKCKTAKFSLVRELPKHFVNIFLEARKYNPDLIFGMGAYSAFAGAVTRTPVVSVCDSEPTSVDHAVSKPFTDVFLTPATFEKSLGKSHYRFRGFKETAYLHPEVYEVNSDIKDRLTIDDEPYVILRFNAFGSHHDVSHGGFSQKQKKNLINKLSQYAIVFVSDESNKIDFSSINGREFDLHPALMHDALANASLLVADTQTMVTEAALLGTPAIRSNSFVGDSDMGNFKDLEENKLIYNLREFEEVLEKAIKIIRKPEIGAEWKIRRDEYLNNKVNLTNLITDIAMGAADGEKEVETVIQQHRELFN